MGGFEREPCSSASLVRAQALWCFALVAGCDIEAVQLRVPVGVFLAQQPPEFDRSPHPAHVNIVMKVFGRRFAERASAGFGSSLDLMNKSAHRSFRVSSHVSPLDIKALFTMMRCHDKDAVLTATVSRRAEGERFSDRFGRKPNFQAGAAFGPITCC